MKRLLSAATRSRLALLLVALLLAGLLAACEAEEDGPTRVETEAPSEQIVPTAIAQQEEAEEFVAESTEQIEVEPADEEPAALNERFSVGDVIEARGMWMTVNEVSFLEEGDVEFFGPDSGNRFVIIDVTFENRTDSPKHISSLLQTELRDGSGQRYTTDIMAVTATGGSTLDGEIAPGDRLRGQAGFQVPVNATDLVFYYDASVFGLGQQVRVAVD